MNYYLDNAATTKPKQAVIDAINKCLIETWGNPSSLHTLGKAAKNVVDENRKIVADFIGAKPKDIIFTSGACEANSLALCGYLDEHVVETLITTSIEHKSIINISKAYRDKTVLIPVNNKGLVDLQQLENVLKDLSYFARPIVSIQYANNEIGTIQDMMCISEIVHRYDGILHTDATQIIPDRKINIKGIDMLSFSGQKLGAPKGIGVLYVKGGVELKPIIYGSQEMARRGGTENVPYIAGLGEAIRHIEYTTGEVRDYFVQQVLAQIPNCYLVGVEGERRLKNNASICFSGINSELLLLMLNERGIYASAGSACNHEPSHVLMAIRLSDEDIGSTVRFTFGDQTKDDVDYVVDNLVEIVGILRNFNKAK
jgi:cysteine desulfurase